MSHSDRRRVLLVEDDPDVVKLMGWLLTAFGYAYDVARSYQEGAAKVYAAYDYALLDLMLGDGTGDTLIDPIRVASPACLVIVITAHPESPKVATLRDRGVAVFLKPLDLDRLFGLMRDHPRNPANEARS